MKTNINTRHTTIEEHVSVPSGTIPTAKALFSFFETFAVAKEERREAKVMAKLQKAFARALRFGRWGETITLRGFRYGDYIGNPWLSNFIFDHGYEVVRPQYDPLKEGFNYKRSVRAHKSPLRLRRRAVRLSDGRVLCYPDE